MSTRRSQIPTFLGFGSLARKAISRYSFYHFHPLHRHFDIGQVTVAESLPLRIAGSRTRTGNLWTLEFALFTLALVADVVRRMLKTWVALGNFSRVLLNLIKRLIYVKFKDFSSLPMFTQLAFIFSLYFTNYGWFTPYLLFPCLICLVSVMMCIFNWEEFIYGTFVDCIGLWNSNCCSLYFRISVHNVLSATCTECHTKYLTII